jgi:glycosyltransferase involved in cell wall biosynthesis
LARLTQRFLLPYNDGLPWAVHVLLEAESVLARRPIAAILSTSPPVGIHLAALRIKRRHRLPWIADFRDPIRGNPFRSRRWIYPYDRMVENRIVRHADALVANTDVVAEMWGRHHPEAVDKIHTLWNGFDPDDRARPLPPPPRDRRVLAHVGSLGPGRQPDVLLPSLVRLVESGELAADSFRVQLVGRIQNGRLEGDRSAEDKLRAWGCLEYDGHAVPRAEAQRAGAEADYLLLLDLNDEGASLQVPAKVFEYVQIGRPILAFTTRRDSPTERILRGSGVPYQIVHQDTPPDEVDRRVLRLFALPTEPVRPSAWFEEHFDGRKQVRDLARLLDELCEQARRRERRKLSNGR